MKLSFSKYFKLAVGTLATSSAFLFGAYDDGCCFQDCGNPCQSDNLLDGFEFGAEFLYWEPFVDNIDYAFNGSGSSSSLSSSEISGNFRNLCHDWTPGFRIYGALRNDMCCGMNLSASYTRLEDSKSKRLAPNGVLLSSLFGPIADLASITNLSATHCFEYQTFDVLFSHDFCLTECHQFTPFFGVEGMSINQHTSSRILGTSTLIGASPAARVNYKNDFWGIGLKLGTEYRYQLFDCLSLYGKASGSILVGEAKSHNSQLNGFIVPGPESASGEFTIDSSSRLRSNDWAMVPGIHVGVGFRYDTTICDWGIVATIGYEFIDWINVPKARHFLNPVTTASSSSSSAFTASVDRRNTNVGFHGLNLGVAVRF